MIKSSIICDRLMYGALLGMIWFIPYGRAGIEAFLLTMIIAWAAKRFLAWNADPRQGLSKTFGVPSSGMGWPLIAIGLLIVLTIPFSHYPSLSLKKFFTRFLQQIFIMYATAEIVHTRRRLYGVLAMLSLMIFFVCTEALAQYALGHNVTHHALLIFGRVSGPMHHPNDLGTLLVTVLPVALALVIIKQRPWMRGMIWVLFVSAVIVLGLTSSRGAWVGFAGSMVVLGLCLRRWRVMVGIILMLIVFFWIFGMNCLSTRTDLYSVPMSQGPVMQPSFANPMGMPAKFSATKILLGESGRELYWHTAENVIKKYPWFGCGYNAYVQTLKDLKVGHEEYPHDSLLHITAELGIFGLLFYLWLFVALCVKSVKILRTVFSQRDLYVLGCGLFCGVLAWMIHSLTDTPWSSLQLNILLWVLIGILLSLSFIAPDHKEG